MHCIYLSCLFGLLYFNRIKGYSFSFILLNIVDLQCCINFMCIAKWFRLLFSSVTQSVQLFATPWTAACQASWSFNSQSLFKLMSIESVMPPNHLILCRSLLLLLSVFPSIRIFSSESVLRIRWPKIQVYIYIYIYIYTYIYNYIYVIHTYIHTYIYIYNFSDSVPL